MHGMKVFLHRTCVLETLAVIPFSAVSKRNLFECLHMVLQRQTFRDGNGIPYRPLKRIFTEVNMSARDRVHLLFLLPHVLGHSGHVLPPRLRDPMLTAIAHAQLLIIACSGQRSYNRNELRSIFDEGWLTLSFWCFGQSSRGTTFYASRKSAQCKRRATNTFSANSTVTVLSNNVHHLFEGTFASPLAWFR